jgi:hypothetical protein
MAEQPQTFESSTELAKKLSEILVNGALYRTHVYLGKECHSTHTGQYGQKSRSANVPVEIKMFCSDEACEHETWWVTDHPQVFFGSTFIYDRKYKCKNCGVQTAHYFFIWQERQDHNLFVKVGQYPELEERVPRELEQALGARDLKFYKNALRLRNFNLGLASAAYMRRVVENRMNDMLDILHEAAVAHNLPEELLKRHEEVKKDKSFAVKIDYAGELLPQYLRPAGKPNPMRILHELTSDGLHAKSDEECVDIFDLCRKTFEFVFGKLRVEAEQAKSFVQGMATLTEHRAKIVSQKDASR